jgi:putative modified peptide
MADSSLSKEQGLALLKRLAQDDGFRAHYEQKPAEALHQLGVPAEQIVRLPGRCICPGKIASKQAMEQARQRLEANLDTAALSFVVPDPKL